MWQASAVISSDVPLGVPTYCPSTTTLSCV